MLNTKDKNKTKNQTKDLGLLKVNLSLRIDLFKRLPTNTNMRIAYALIEELILETFTGNTDKIDMKVITRFDKLKSLALNTNQVNERKLAFNKSLEVFKKLTQLTLS